MRKGRHSVAGKGLRKFERAWFCQRSGQAIAAPQMSRLRSSELRGLSKVVLARNADGERSNSGLNGQRKVTC